MVSVSPYILESGKNSRDTQQHICKYQRLICGFLFGFLLLTRQQSQFWITSINAHGFTRVFAYPISVVYPITL